MEYVFTLFFYCYAACRRKFHGKGIKLKTFPQSYLISLCGVVVRCSRVKPKVPGSSFTQLFFFPFIVLLFSINIYLNNCYLMKCNRQQEKCRVSREKIVHRILNKKINNLNFYHFLQFTQCGKTRGENRLIICDPPQEFDAKGESTRTTRLHDTLSVP